LATRADSKTEARVFVVQDGASTARIDQLATEEPLEIRLRAGRAVDATGPVPVFRRQGAGPRTLSVTMRTPGHDFELAAGFLYGEGIVRGADEIHAISHSDDAGTPEDRRHNIVNVDLRRNTLPDLQSVERQLYATSACGVCGKASLEALRLRGAPAIAPGPVVKPGVLRALPDRLRAGQGLFDATGGLHAAGLFDLEGNLLALREDGGRHNAVDKLVGWALLQEILPLSRHIVMVSGRTSFEILQKCLMAGVPIVCAVSAPSSLAVAVARDFGMTLVGFLRGDRFNVYAGVERVDARQPPSGS
jgi:FdhD protein